MTLEASSAAFSLVGQCIDGRMRIEARIDTGATDTGSTFRAQHLARQVEVAVKFLPSDPAATFRRSQFEQEAAAIARLEHPNIASVLDWGVYSGRLYVASEWLEGESLAARLRRGPTSFAESQSIARQLLAALSAAHVAGLAHRNLKLENVFLQRRERGAPRVKLLDFGLSPALPKPAPRASALPADRLAAPHFIAPEQRAGETPDARSDVYAAGEILAALLGFQRRTRASEISETWLVEPRLHVAAEPNGRARGADAAARAELAQRRSSFMVERSAALLGLDRGLSSVIERARARQPSERYASAAQMLAELIDRLPREQRDASEAAPANDAIDAREVVQPAAAATRDADAGATAAAVDAIGAEALAPATAALQHAAVRPANGNALIHAPARSPAAPLRTGGRGRAWLGVEALIVAGFVLLGAASVMLVVAWRGGEDARRDALAAARTAESQPAAATIPATAHTVTSVAALSEAPNPPAPIVLDARPAVPEPTATAPASASTSAPSARSPATAATPLASTSARTSVRPTSPAAYETAAQKPVSFRSQHSPEARNPWLEPLPAAFEGVHDLIARRDQGDELLLQKLRSYNYLHPKDPRGCILLGALYLNRLWRSDAIQQFALAIERDASARGAPEILPRLLRLVILGKEAAEAQRLIVVAFGLEALPAIDAALANVTSAATAKRLHALSAEISAPYAAPAH